MTRALAASLCLIAAATLAQESEENKAPFDEIKTFLAAHSSIAIDAESKHPREDIATSGELGADNVLAVQYHRNTYQSVDAKSLQRSQVIYYFAPIAEIDPASITVQNAGERSPGVPFWMVSFGVRKADTFFGYNNHIFHYGETADAQVFRSKGKSRQVILGYVATEALATELAEKFRTFLKANESTPAEVKRPGQSAA